MRIKCSIIFIFLSLSLAWPADKQVRGKIISADDKEPLVSATVYILPDDLKSINHSQQAAGTLSDIDGHFSLLVPEGIKRIFCSYLGYKDAEVVLNGKGEYFIEMQPAAVMLNDFVVTGYQEVERRKLTAAISKIEISDETVGAIRSIDQALSGKIAGLSAITDNGAPGAPVKIRIRGTSSLNGTQDPLWILDGIPLEGNDIPVLEDLKDIDDIFTSSIAGLNPADIADITVLKDAAATAIYGTRAANGVIVITTKSGKIGKNRVNFSTRMQYTPTVNIDRLNRMNSSEKVALELELLRTDYNYRSDKGGVAQIINGYGELANYKSGGWDALSASAQTDILGLNAINTDWNDILFRSTFSQEYNLNLSGGNDAATYYTSLGYVDEQGNVTGVEMTRFNITAKLKFNLSKKLRVGASVYANRRKNTSFLSDFNSVTNPINYSRNANPYQQVYDTDGNYIYDSNLQWKDDALLDFNIFEERNNTSHDRETNGLSSIFDVELRLSEKIKFVSQIGVQYDNSSSTKIADNDSYHMRRDKYRTTLLVNGEYQSFLPDGGKYNEKKSSTSQLTGKFMGEYRHVWHNRHELEVMAGSELRKNQYDQTTNTGYGFDRRTLTTKPVIYPSETWAQNFQTSPVLAKIENAYVSWFSTFSYSFLRKYTLGGSVRFDGSNLFGVDKKYRYLPLYSVSGLWRISEEDFLKDFAWIDNFVFRSSYGLQGNIDKNTSPFIIGRYAQVSILPGTIEQQIVIDSPPNDKLRWEKTHSFNAGFDAAVFDQALNLVVNYYYRKGNDLIAEQNLPLESGFYTSKRNWASMRNQGIEISIGTRNIFTKTFSWYTQFNFSYNNNIVLKDNIAENSTSPSREGYPVDAIFGFRYGGLDEEGYPLFITKDGQKLNAKDYFQLSLEGPGIITSLTAEQQRDLYHYIGTSEPPYTGGFTNTFRYKAFELGINCIFNLGHYATVPASYSLTSYDRGMNSNRDILNRWTPSNTTTRFPALLSDNKRLEEYRAFSLYNYDKDFDFWIKKNNYMRVQSLRLGYSLPETILKLFGMNAGTVSLEGRNLFVVASDYNNSLDPETIKNPYAQPIPKSIIFSLNLNF